MYTDLGVLGLRLHTDDFCRRPLFWSAKLLSKSGGSYGRSAVDEGGLYNPQLSVVGLSGPQRLSQVGVFKTQGRQFNMDVWLL